MIDFETKEIQKNHITVLFEDKENQVSWYVDTPIEDVRFAILCACDSLADGEFEILDFQAKKVNLDDVQHFKNNSIYFLRKKHNKPTNILLDGSRKLYVEIEPMQHLESQVAVKYMVIGSNLLKHSRNGFPHIRNFQLSGDLKRILWYTKNKSITESQISFDSIIDIVVGQKSEAFKRYPLKMLEEFSFSIYYKSNDGNKTLDLTCKDEREFDLWLIGIKALHCLQLDKIINKYNLLYHCKSFLLQIEKGNIGSSSKFLFYENNENDETDKKEINPNQKRLENFVLGRSLSHQKIADLLIRLIEKHKNLKNEVLEINESDSLNTGEMKNDYEMIFAEEAIVDDLETQKNQMMRLTNSVENCLANHLQEFIAYVHQNQDSLVTNDEDKDVYIKAITKLELISETSLAKNLDFIPQNLNNEFFLKELDIKLWKVEIDIENIGDIITRFKAPHNPGILQKIKNIFKSIRK